MTTNFAKSLTRQELEKICKEMRSNYCVSERSSVKINIANANFENEDLSGLDLRLVTFLHCNFNNVNFSKAKLNHTQFENCTITTASFDGCISSIVFYLCDLFDVDFKCDIDEIYLFSSVLKPSRFEGSNIRNLYICNSEASECTFKHAKIHTIEHITEKIRFPEFCPSEGEFVAWKKAIVCKNHKSIAKVLVKLRIPADAERTTFSVKCRASKAEVLEFEDLDGNPYVPGEGEGVFSMFCIDCKEYIVGETIYPDFFDNSITTCSNGIHFFYCKEDALDYGC